MGTDKHIRTMVALSRLAELNPGQYGSWTSKTLRPQLDAIEIPESPFTKAVGLPRIRAHWVRPQLVVQVAFIEWTVHGKLRHPRLLGLREDKAPLDVVRETP